MHRKLIPAFGLSGLCLLGGCLGGGNTSLTTVPTAHLAITLPATSATAGTPFTFTVSALDAANVVVPTYIGTVHIATSDTSARLPADATLTGGVGTFTVTFNTTGSQTITASDTVGDASSGNSPAVSVKPIPVPTITSLSPTMAAAGGMGFTLTVNGSNFVLASAVQWNGSNRSTAFVNTGQVTAQISAADIATPGTVAVTVFNPAPGGGASNTSTLTITKPTSGCGGLGGGPQSIAVDPTGKFAYVAKTDCTLAYAGHVSMYAINATTGILTSIGPPVPTQDEGAISVAVDPAGKFAYVANWGGGDTAGSVSKYTIDATTGALTSIATIQAPCAPSPGSCAPFSVAVDRSGKFAYAANEGGFAPTSVSMYLINATTGALTFTGTVTVVSGGRASSVTADPKGNFVYVTVTTDNPATSAGGVFTYSVNASTGALTVVGSIATGIHPVSVTVDPAGKFVYVANSDSNEVSMYTIDATAGSLTSTGTVAAGTNPAAVAVDPASKFAYVANSGSNDVSMYTINSTTGVLTAAGTIATELAPTSVAIDPSGKFAYVTNSASSDVSMYSIDAATGALTLIGTIGT